MKKLFLLTLLMAGVMMGVEAQNRSIGFEQTRQWKKVIKKAKKEKKLIFVDCYTSWCGPCRQMATREFVKPEAGTYFNEKFVCVKYDMERGEGIQLRERFKVTAYPTFLLLKSNGTEIGRLVGGNELLPFILI